MQPPRRMLALAVFLWFVAPVVAQEPEPNAIWTALRQPKDDPERVFQLENVKLKREAFEFTFRDGRVEFVQPAAGVVWAGVFTGAGALRMVPPNAIEAHQLQRRTGQPELNLEFDKALLIFTDETYDELSRQGRKFSGGGSFLTLYKERQEKMDRWGLNWEPQVLRSLLSLDRERTRLFHAQVYTSQKKWVMAEVDRSSEEQVSVGQLDEGLEFLDVWNSFPAGATTPSTYSAKGASEEIRVDRYKLDVTVPPNVVIAGKARVQFKVMQPGGRVLLFSLVPWLRVSEVLDEDDNKLAFFQPREPKEGEAFFGAYLAVVLPKPLEPDTLRYLRFTYGGKRVVRKVGTGNFFCQSYGWYPTVGYPGAHRYNYDFTLRVPKKYIAVATGTKTGESVEGDYLVTQWKSEEAMPEVGFAFGDYKVTTEKIGEVSLEVYANKSADDTLAQIETFARTERTGTVGLESLQPARLSKTVAAEVGNSLKLMQAFFGPYTYNKLAVSNIPYSYGQGWPSLLYLTSLSFLDSTQRHQLGIRDQVGISDHFRAHETSHQWWGNMVGWKTYHDQWLSEGFAEYSGTIYVLYRRDVKEYLNRLQQLRDNLTVKTRMSGEMVDSMGPIWLGRRVLSSKTIEGGNYYQDLIYGKGAYVLHMLRMMMFDQQAQDPDARFKAMMQDFTQSFHGRAASTADFQGIVEKHMTPVMNMAGNGKMDWFFDQWVYGTGIPRYKLTYQITDAGPGRWKLSGSVVQSEVPENFRMPFGIYATVSGKKGRLGFIQVVGKQTPFDVTLPFRPEKISINDFYDVLARD